MSVRNDRKRLSEPRENVNKQLPSRKRVWEKGMGPLLFSNLRALSMFSIVIPMPASIFEQVIVTIYNNKGLDRPRKILNNEEDKDW